MRLDFLYYDTFSIQKISNTDYMNDYLLSNCFKWFEKNVGIFYKISPMEFWNCLTNLFTLEANIQYIIHHQVVRWKFLMARMSDAWKPLKQWIFHYHNTNLSIFLDLFFLIPRFFSRNILCVPNSVSLFLSTRFSLSFSWCAFSFLSLCWNNVCVFFFFELNDKWMKRRKTIKQTNTKQKKTY